MRGGMVDTHAVIVGHDARGECTLNAVGIPSLPILMLLLLSLTAAISRWANRIGTHAPVSLCTVSLSQASLQEWYLIVDHDSAVGSSVDGSASPCDITFAHGVRHFHLRKVQKHKGSDGRRSAH